MQSKGCEFSCPKFNVESPHECTSSHKKAIQMSRFGAFLCLMAPFMAEKLNGYDGGKMVINTLQNGCQQNRCWVDDGGAPNTLFSMENKVLRALPNCAPPHPNKPLNWAAVLINVKIIGYASRLSGSCLLVFAPDGLMTGVLIYKEV